MDRRFIEAQNDYINNNPPVEVNQIWVGHVDGKVYRRIRILAPHPDIDTSDGRRRWIYCNMPGGRLRTMPYELGICPEFNLRYVFQLEKSDDSR